jgi:hypothetical protein
MAYSGGRSLPGALPFPPERAALREQAPVRPRETPEVAEVVAVWVLAIVATWAPIIVVLGLIGIL